MAVQKISTRLAIEGEAEYRAAISRINSELKAQKSALELVEAQYKANSSSTEALSAKSDALNKMLATQREKQEQLEAVIRNALATEEKLQKRKVELTRELEKNQREMERLKSSSEDTNAEQNSLTETEKKLTAELEQTEQAIAKVHNKTNGWETQLNQTQTAVVELETAVKENNAALSNAEKEPGKLQKAFARLGVGAEEGKEGVTALAAALAAQKLPEAFYKIKDALMECVIASEEFESAMAGVKKTTDLSDEELTDLGNRFRTLSTEIPITATELAGIAESAGQLGIQKDSLEDFTVTMANLGVATNMTSEEAATMLARLANVTGMDPGKYENLGSVIVALGNNFATTETEITEMAQKVAAAGRLAGLTEPEILALAASMSSVGIQAEAGGTAMTQTLTAIEKAVTSGGEKLESFAAISDMSAEQFSSVWKSAPAEAIESFITGLGQLDEKGKSATTALDDLGISGIRQSNMLKSMSQASDLMSRALETANGAWEENTALAKEAETRYGTTESKFQMFKNSVDNLKVAIGDQLNPALGNLAEVGTDAVSWATDFIEKNEWLGPVILGIVSALGVLTVGLSGFAIAIKIVIPLIHSFNDAMSMNVLGVTALAIGGVITAITALSRAIQKDNPELEEMTSAARELNDTLENGKKAYEDNIANIEVSANVAEKYIGQLEALEEAGLRTNEQQRAYHGILQQLCDTVPELAQYIDLENNTIEGGTAALRRNTEEWRENAKAKAYQDKLTEVYKAQAEVQYELTLNLSYDLKWQWCKPVAIQGKNVAEFVAHIRTGGMTGAADPFSYQLDAPSTQNDYIDFSHDELFTKREGLLEIAELCGLYIEPDNLTIRLKKGGTETGAVLEKGKNLAELSVRRDSTQGITGVYVYYQDDAQYVPPQAVAPHKGTYGVPHYTAFNYAGSHPEGQFDYPEDANIVTQIGEAYLRNHTNPEPFFSYSAKVADTGQNFSLHDIVTVIHSGFNVSQKMEVQKIVYDVLRQRYTEISVGNYEAPLSKMIAELQNKAKG